MQTDIAIKSPRNVARIAGLLYLILAICGGFAEFFVRQNLIVPGDAVRTAANILSSESLFRAGIVVELIGQVVFVVLALLLYQLLKAINRNLAVLMVILVIVAVTITCANMLNQYGALMMLNGDGFLNAFDLDQRQALAMTFLDLHEAGYMIAQVFFGLWLFPLGYLVYRSRFLPRIVGILLFVACFGYMADVVTYFLFPSFDVVFSEFTFVGELLLLLWLLAKGINVEKWRERAVVAAA